MSSTQHKVSILDLHGNLLAKNLTVDVEEYGENMKTIAGSGSYSIQSFSPLEPGMYTMILEDGRAGDMLLNSMRIEQMAVYFGFKISGGWKTADRK